MKTLGKILILFLGFGTLFSCNEESLNPDSADIYVKYYGGEGQHEGVDVEWVSDGYIIVGNGRETEGKWGLYIVKTDFFGNQQTSPFTYLAQDTTANLRAVDAAINQAGNLVVASMLESSTTGNSCIHVAEFAGTALQNEYIFPDPAQSTGKFNYYPESVTVLRTGDIVVTGSTNQVNSNKPGSETDISDFISLKFTPALQLYPENEWRRSYGQTGPDYGHKVLETNDGLVFFGTGEYSDPDKNLLGQNMYTFMGQNNGFITTPYNVFGTIGADLGGDIAPTLDGGLVVIGNTDVNGTIVQQKERPVIIRMSSGNDAGISAIIDKPELRASKIVESNRGGYIFTGRWSDGSNSAFYVAALNSDFNAYQAFEDQVRWSNRFGFLEGNLERNDGHALIETPEGAVVILGTIDLDSQTKICLIKINPDGQLVP